MLSRQNPGDTDHEQNFSDLSEIVSCMANTRIEEQRCHLGGYSRAAKKQKLKPNKTLDLMNILHAGEVKIGFYKVLLSFLIRHFCLNVVNEMENILEVFKVDI